LLFEILFELTLFTKKIGLSKSEGHNISNPQWSEAIGGEGWIISPLSTP